MFFFFLFSQNDMALKPYDCARLSNRGRDCAEFLLLFETSLGISQELLQAKTKQEALETENNDLKGYFK